MIDSGVFTPMPDYYVEYMVEGFGEQRAGPYTFLEANDHLRDICTYEGVSHARLAFIPDPPKTIFDHVEKDD